MKKMIIAAASLLLYAGIVNAQNEVVYVSKTRESKLEKRELKKEESKNEISFQTKQEFNIDFEDVKDLTWNVSKTFEEASFTQNGVSTTAYYDVDSKLVGTTSPKTFAELPLTAQAYIKKHYGNFEVADVILFDDNEDNETDMVLYDTRFDDADNYFVVLRNKNESVILKVDLIGEVGFFKKI